MIIGCDEEDERLYKKAKGNVQKAKVWLRLTPSVLQNTTFCQHLNTRDRPERSIVLTLANPGTDHSQNYFDKVGSPEFRCLAMCPYPGGERALATRKLIIDITGDRL